MINGAETQLPSDYNNLAINSEETVIPNNINNDECSIVLLAGESIADSYVINSLMENQGKQSDVYLAKKWGKTYVVKIYKDGWRPSNKMKSFLTSVRHPNIAHVIESGEYEGCYYEIYEYYSEGTLEEAGAISATHIKNVIVPSINEGLHELHKNGIIHCDIKPSNLFYADNASRVVIGDCGISGYANSKGKLVDSLRGTPEYAPRVKSLLWSAAMSPAYDYGSFGLVLCRAVLGRSLFEGMTVGEIAEAWEYGLELPSQISGHLGSLIKGLLNEDEDKRWDYIQVKRWCEGEYMRPANRSIYARVKKANQKTPMIFGRFDDQIVSVTTFHQLEQAIKEHWDQAYRIVKRRELIDFVRQFDENLVEKIRELALYQDEDAAVYKLLLYISDDKQTIVYCGKKYDSLSEYVSHLSTGRDEVAKKFLSTGLLIFYLRYNNYNQAQVDKLEQLIRRNRSDDLTSIYTICFALQGGKSIELFGSSVEGINDLVAVLSKRSISDIDALLCNDRFIAWLNKLGYENEMKKMSEGYIFNE